MHDDLDLNKSGALPDGTAASQKPEAPRDDVTASELRKGFSSIATQKPSVFDNGLDDITDVPAESLYDAKSGGFAGRPQGWTR